MVFSSVVFLFYFLPLFLVTFYASRCSKNVTAVFSIIFYAWGEPVYILLLIASIAMNYGLGLVIEQAQDSGRRRTWLTVGVVANLIPLLWFKYSAFLASSVVGIAGIPDFKPSFMPTALPLGISFFTFHALSYLIDVYRKHVRAERSVRDMILYIAMFPQLVAGPLIRYKTIADEIHQPVISVERTARGIRTFIIGLSQKVLIANTLGASADAIFALPADQLSPSLAWLGIVCYTLQIYFDFGGYSNMAIGLAFMIGFTFPLNFNYPYVSRSMTEFWRRWHITLSSWFRDYVYIPLGGNRGSAGRTYFNLTVVFVLCGFWHGAAWTFVVWGLAHGFFLVIERAGLGRVLAGLPPVLQHAYLLFVVMMTWVLFRADTLAHAGYYFSALAGFAGPTPLAPPAQRFLGWDVLLALAAGLLAMGPYGAALAWRVGRRLQVGSAEWSPIAELGSLAVLFLMTSMSLAGGVYNPFIYFRF